MILFKKLRYKNFLSTGAAFTEIDFIRSPNTLVIGINGAGKSTMLDAITFVLFGKSFRGINLPNLINSVNEKECLVEIEFSVGVKEYKIERGLKPAVFNIFVDGVLLNQEAKAKDYQSILETHILKFNYKAFTQIVILGSSSFKPFMQLPAADRRSVIEDLLDIEIFSAMNVVVKNRLTDIKQSLSDAKAKLESTNARIDLQKKHVEEAKKNTSELVNKIQDDYNEKNFYVQDQTIVANDIIDRINTLMDKISDKRDVQDKINQLVDLKNKINVNLMTAQKHLKFYKDNDNCPTCAQDLEQTFRADAQLEAQLEINLYSDTLEKITTQISDKNAELYEINQIEKEINEGRIELSRVKALIGQVREHMENLERDIEATKNRKVLSDDMIKVSETLLRDLEELTELRKTLTESKKYYDLAATLLKDNGIKSKIIKQYMPIINKMINKYLMSMDAFFNFEIDEEFKETIKSRYRDTFQYENFSEGEKFKIDISLLFTWRTIAKYKNSIDTNLLILDEVFDGPLDSLGTEDFLKILSQLGGSTNVFVISPKGDLLTDKFRSVIKFQKDGLFSRIV